MHALLLAVIAQASVSSAFPIIRSTKIPDQRRIRDIPTASYSAANDSDNDGSEGRKEDGLALPAIGASSFWDLPRNENAANSNFCENSDLSHPSSSQNSEKKGIIISEHASGIVSPKFQIQYTCKICGYRNSHAVTRVAYRNGVVIAMCKGCHTKHWIADHLGWSNHVGGFDFDNGERDIEMFMENRDNEAREMGNDHEKDGDLVKRVSQDVFDLEKMLYNGQAQENDTISGEGTKDEKEKGWS